MLDVHNGRMLCLVGTTSPMASSTQRLVTCSRIYFLTAISSIYILQPKNATFFGSQISQIFLDLLNPKFYISNFSENGLL